jgi:hypothetical protein
MPPAAHAALVISIFASVLGALVMCAIAIRYGLGSADETDGGSMRQFVTRFGHAVAGVCFAATGIMAIVVFASPRPAPPVVAPQPDRAAEARLQALTDDMKSLGARLEQRLDQLDGRVGAVDSRVGAVDNRVGVVDSHARRLGDEVESLSLRARQMERAIATPPRRAAAVEPAPKPAAVKEPVREPVSPSVVKEPSRVSERFAPAPPAPTASDTATPATSDPAAATRPWSPASRAPEKTTPPPVVRAPEPASGSQPTATPSRSLPSSARAQEPPVVAAPPAGNGGAAATKSDDDLKEKFREDWKAIRGGFATAGDDFKNAMRDFRQKLWR